MKAERIRLATLTLFAAFAPGMVLAQGLPGGASTLDETHGDWRVVCAAPQGNVQCAISQSQVSSENRQRVLTIELRAAEEGDAANGVLLLPFGLRLADGVALTVDENPASQMLAFSTCLTAGCLVPLAFDAEAVSALRAGTTLFVNAAVNDNGQEIAFSISLTGFTSAFARLVELNGA